jgi:hypothetical protein
MIRYPLARTLAGIPMELIRLPWERWTKKKTGKKATTKAIPTWEVEDESPKSPEKQITTRAGRGVKKSSKLK